MDSWDGVNSRLYRSVYCLVWRRVKFTVNHNQLEILLVITNSPLLSVGSQWVDTVGTGHHHLSQPCSCVPTDYPPSGTAERDGVSCELPVPARLEHKHLPGAPRPGQTTVGSAGVNRSTSCVDTVDVRSETTQCRNNPSVDHQLHPCSEVARSAPLYRSAV